VNLIRKYTFDLHFTERELATALQDTVSRVFNASIESETSALFDRLFSSAESLWLDTLELDLGVLSYDHIERDLTARIMEALEEALKDKIVHIQKEETGSLYFQTETDREFALIAHYLQTGSLPWWAADVILEDIILRLIKDARFARFIIDVAQPDYVVKRIVYHFSAYVVEQIINTLEEEQAAFIFGYTREVIALQSKQSLIKSEQSEFEKAVWIFVLTYLVTENSGQFNRKQFIRRNLERLALHFNIDYQLLLQTFRQAMDFYKKDIPEGSFTSFIKILYEENGTQLLQEVYNELLVRDQALPGNITYQEVPGEPVNVFVPGITRLSPDIPLPLSWIGYDSITIQSERQEVWQQAINLFTIFITGQQLPSWFSRLPEARQAILLRQAVILLFRKRPLLLAEIWEHGGHKLSSRLYVHQLFEKPVTPLEENIRKQLQAYAERDTIAFFQQNLGDSFLQQRESFLEIWKQYHDRPQSERLAFYRQILSATVVVQQVALNLPEDDFWVLMEDVPSLWDNHTIAALQQWQQLMESMVVDNLERERVRLLFKQFNLQWLAGKVHITDTVSYTREWLVFLNSFNETATRKLLGVLATTTEIDTRAYMHIQAVIPVMKEQAVVLVRNNAQEMSNVVAVMRNRDSLRYDSSAGLLSGAADSLRHDSSAGLQRGPSDGLPRDASGLLRDASTGLLKGSSARLLPGTANGLSPQRQEEFARRNRNKKHAPVATSEETGIYVNNAGLVLLHPFIHTYFTRLQLITTGKFNNDAAQLRAIHLLQLLVYGNSEQPEHALVLNKVLCNVPLETPVENIQFTEDEKQLSLQLLNAATQQWEKMKNTSIEGFRASFLQRDGILWQEEGAWFLKVKPRSYDIILQTLPWSMGMIKPSWADKILYTEWEFS
jgi:hypothetical protein